MIISHFNLGRRLFVFFNVSFVVFAFVLEHVECDDDQIFCGLWYMNTTAEQFLNSIQVIS